MPRPTSKPLIPGPGANALPVPPVQERDNKRGILWILLSVFAASVMTLTVRQLAAEFDSRLIVLFRSVLTMGLLGVLVILFSPLRRNLRFSKPWLHIARGTAIGISTHLGFYTIASIPLATATVLMFTAPVFATLISVVIHGEKIGPRRIAAIAVGFIGALIILRPGGAPLQLGMLSALASSMLFATALSMSRPIAEADGPLSAFTSSVVLTAIISVPLAAPVWAVPTDIGAWLAIGLLIIGGGLRNLADLQAYRHAEAAVLAPITYLRLVLIGTAAYFLFGESPDTPTLIGAAIIISSTLYVARREAALKHKKSRP